MVYILLGTGFEEAEALVPADLLRRAGIETALVGVDSMTVTGGHGHTVAADLALSAAELERGRRRRVRHPEQHTRPRSHPGRL